MTRAARANARRPNVLLMLLLGAVLSGHLAPAGAQVAFERYEVVTGPAQHQTVLTGFFLGGTSAELAVVKIGKHGARRLQIFALDDGTWVPRLDPALSSDVLFVDVARIGGRDRLVTYEPGRLSWLDLESATERQLVAVNSRFNVPRSGGIPHVDVSWDVNADGRDDLVVPDLDGFWVFVQMRGGELADPVKLGRSAGVGTTIETGGYRYSPWAQGRVHEMDYNRDGRSDLVFWNEGHFAVHLQDERGLFAPAVETFSTDVSFDTDDLASLAAPVQVRHRRTDRPLRGDPTGRALHSFTDMNGDGVADLVVFSLDGANGRLAWHSTYEVHFGTPTSDGGIEFANDVGTAIRSDGIPLGLGQHDLGHDGQVGVMFTTLKLNRSKLVGMITRALLTRSISLRLELYRMENGHYPDKPSFDRKIKGRAPGVSGERGILYPAVLIGDVSGDRRSDLLVQKGQEELHVFLGVPGPDLFARRPQKVAVEMPDEEYTWLVDLNNDGKQDILMHHPSTTEPHRLTLLVAR